MYTREEFERKKQEWADAMTGDGDLAKSALDLLMRADRHNWIHQTTWLGQPILQLPQDMFALQEIIFKTRPRYIVEIGVAWGGALLFYSTLMEVLGGGMVVGVDVYVPADLKRRIGAHGRLSDRIAWVNASSVEQSTVEKVRSMVGDTRDVLVILDSFHSHDHVLKELRLYAPLVGKEQYLVCCDTVVEDFPEQIHRPRPWGPGNNPRTALTQFLRENDRFEVDRTIGNKLLLSCNPDGYLRCVKD